MKKFVFVLLVIVISTLALSAFYETYLEAAFDIIGKANTRDALYYEDASISIVLVPLYPTFISLNWLYPDLPTAGVLFSQVFGNYGGFLMIATNRTGEAFALPPDILDVDGQYGVSYFLGWEGGTSYTFTINPDVVNVAYLMTPAYGAYPIVTFGRKYFTFPVVRDTRNSKIYSEITSAFLEWKKAYNK